MPIALENGFYVTHDLAHVSCLAKARDRGLGSLARLELLRIWRYPPKTKDFSEFEFPASLDERQINWANASGSSAIYRVSSTLTCAMRNSREHAGQ
jgi:hypothetical protein